MLTVGQISSDAKYQTTEVKQCDNGSYCCGTTNTAVSTNATTCCSEGNGFFLKDGIVTLANQTTSSASTTGLPSAHASTSAAPPPPDSSTGAIAGGTVGGVAVLGILAGLIIFLGRRARRHKNESEDLMARNDLWRDGGETYKSQPEESHLAPLELDAATEPIEKDGTPVGVKGTDGETLFEKDGTTAMGEQGEQRWQ